MAALGKVQNHDVSADIDHRTSAQHQEALSHNSAADLAHQHNHGHVHHDADAEQGRDDELAYFKESTVEKSIPPHQDPQHHDLHRRHHPDGHQNSVDVLDAEKGAIDSILSEEEDRQSHKVSGFYTKYRVFFHLLIWLFFTG